MRKTLWVFVLFWAVGVAATAEAGIFDDIMKELPGAKSGVSQAGPDQKTTVAGLKEALAIGTENAVKAVSKTDGYFSNKMVKILLPDKIQKIADVVAKLGYQEQVDNFILSMNRSAEAAVPKASRSFTATKGQTCVARRASSLSSAAVRGGASMKVSCHVNLKPVGIMQILLSVCV